MAETKAPQQKDKPHTHHFQAEVSRLLDIMVHSIYSEREVFLRELISNAADACDKLRYEALTRPELLADDPELKITLRANGTAGTLTVSDNGIGMNHDDLVDQLGTIARSGTRAFMEEASKKGENDRSALIGQFGVGFYSAFMVASHIDVISRRAGEDKVWKWSSDGSGSFTVSEVSGDLARAHGRGTAIVLTLRDDAREFLEADKLEHIVKTYSDHVPLPIELAGRGEDDEKKLLNAARALWTRPKSELTAEDYKEFYGHISGLYDDPALTVHYRAEGRHEYSVLLFVPGSAPFDLFDPDRKGRVRLYVRRVLITDEADILPAYLRFVRGVVDSEDMPLTVSREMLQNNPVAASIRKAVTRRVLSELGKVAEKDPETYAKIWETFGAVIKEGLYEDFERRDSLLELVRFNSTEATDGLRSLKDYVAAMSDTQKAIYFITGDNAESIAASPHLEGFRARGIEVLLLSDPVDSFWTTTATGYDGKPFKSITRGAADLDDIPLKEKDKADKDDADTDTEGRRKADSAALAAFIKQTLEGEVTDVTLSSRLVDSPVCLVAAAAGPDLALEKILKQSKGGALKAQHVLEINPDHSLIRALAAHLKTDQGVVEDAAHLLLDQARIAEGETPPDPAAFTARLDRLILKGLTATAAKKTPQKTRKKTARKSTSKSRK